MNGFTSIAILGALALLMLHSAYAQTVYIVGDNIGWSVPSNGAAAYTNWASGKTFSVGDVLVFNFATNSHDVQQVPRASFDACTSDNAIGNVILNGPANITLSSAGEHYYICTIGRHCLAGQKLAISVSVSGTPGSPANPPTTTAIPSRPPVTVTPSPNSNEPDDCAPAPSPSSISTPAGGSNNSPLPLPLPRPLPSSSTALFSSLSFTLASSIAMAAFLYY